MEGVKKPNIKKWISLFALLLMCCGSLLAQDTHYIIGKSVLELRREKIQQAPSLISQKLPLLLSSEKKSEVPFFTKAQNFAYQAPKLYQYKDLAFFCRLEVKMDQAAKMPVRFRLGSVDYVDRMEGKY